MLSTQNHRVKIAIILRGDGSSICLSADLDTLVVRKTYMFNEGVGIEGYKQRVVEAHHWGRVDGLHVGEGVLFDESAVAVCGC
jgi:hypothetical protein